MRDSYTTQLPLLPNRVDHPHARELETIARLLDRNRILAELATQDLHQAARCDRGAPGMTGDQVVRSFLIKHMNSFSYNELEFHLRDSNSYRRFCRLGLAHPGWSRSTLQRNIACLSVSTLEMMNDVLVMIATDAGIEDGRTVRTDATPVAAPIHAPSDSSLLWDTVRTLVRLMKKIRRVCRDFHFNNQAKRARRLFQRILNAKRADRRPLYRELIDTTRTTISTARRAVASAEAGRGETASKLADELRRYIELGERVIDQTARRVFNGEQVPADEKLVSIFEEHADIIAKDRRETLYGHKLFLTAGASGMVLDCELPRGNPNDSTTARRLMERVCRLFEKPPEKAAFDGGFSSKVNLTEIKALGIANVVFSKHRGMTISQMVEETWLYQSLKRFRAGVEGIISFLKRGFGLGRCEDKGWEGFQRYVYRSIIAYNLLLVSRRSG